MTPRHHARRPRPRVNPATVVLTTLLVILATAALLAIATVVLPGTGQ